MSSMERHFSVAQVAEMWGLSEETVRRIFLDEPGVVRFGLARRKTLRIPESVVNRVHMKASAKEYGDDLPTPSEILQASIRGNRVAKVQVPDLAASGNRRAGNSQKPSDVVLGTGRASYRDLGVRKV